VGALQELLVLLVALRDNPVTDAGSSKRKQPLKTSVADPNPGPSDPYVFGHPGSGSINQRYGSRSGSFHHQEKIVRKALIPTVLRLLFDFLSSKNDVCKCTFKK
jgi:hypothetical protein